MLKGAFAPSLSFSESAGFSRLTRERSAFATNVAANSQMLTLVARTSPA
jgi:hypothetical protein